MTNEGAKGPPEPGALRGRVRRDLVETLLRRLPDSFRHVVRFVAGAGDPHTARRDSPETIDPARLLGLADQEGRHVLEHA